jgi:hypothetical protein
MESEEDCDVHNFDRHFVVVEYPGVVLNEDRAIRTLGGLQNISTVSDTIGNCCVYEVLNKWGFCSEPYPIYFCEKV